MTPHQNTHINLPPLPEHDVEEWSESGITLRYVGWSEEKVLAYAESFRNEQATSVAELKAKLVEVMPLAKFGAEVLKTYKEVYVSDEEIGNFALNSGCLTQPIKGYAPNIESTITKLLKD
jgi:hypothetical protein